MVISSFSRLTGRPWAACLPLGYLPSQSQAQVLESPFSQVPGLLWPSAAAREHARSRLVSTGNELVIATLAAGWTSLCDVDYGWTGPAASRHLRPEPKDF